MQACAALLEVVDVNQNFLNMREASPVSDTGTYAAVSDIQLRRKDYAKARFYLKQAIATDANDPELEARQKQLDLLSAQ